MKSRSKFLIAGFAIWLTAAAALKAPVPITIVRADAKVSYPTEIDFSLEARGVVEIRTVELEYGLSGRDCSPDVVIAVPDSFTPGTSVKAQWVWNVSELGDLPPGMKIWWDWRLVDADGQETRSAKKWVTWIDSIHSWTSISSGNIILHWYQGTEAYARDLMKSAEDARVILKQDVGAWPDSDINLYIYASNQEMKDALPGAKDWIGGLSFSENQRTIMIGIGPGEEAWGKSTIKHELAHVAAGSIMGGCYGSIPLWLNEGIAVYTEGTPDPLYVKLIEQAVYNDELFSLRSISDQYQEINGDPSLTYAESLSVVQFLVREYGHEKIRNILVALGEGYTYDSSLQSALGLDMDGLDDAWRKSLGADARPKKSIGASPTPLTAGTLPPFSSTPIYSTLTPTENAAPTNPPAAGGLGGAAKALTKYPGNLISIVCLMMTCLLMAGLIAVVILFSRRNSGSGKG
jgi:hypothetical protein